MPLKQRVARQSLADMNHKRKIYVLLPMLAFVILGTAAIRRSGTDRNLKVLPKDISDARLDSIMQTYNKALGVKCDFCHVPVKGYKDSLDYASDAIAMKETARKMMRMTIKINQENFYFDKTKMPEYLNTVRCMTCHQGEAFPPE